MDVRNGMSNSINGASYTFRPGSPSDATAISELVSTTWEKTYGPHVTRDDLAYYLRDVVSTTAFSKDLASPKHRFVLAYSSSSFSSSSTGHEDSRELVGVAQLTLASSDSSITLPKPIELQRFYVGLSHHGTGLARALMSQVEDQALSEGAESIWLGVWENADRAKAFYAKCGFEECGEHDFPVGTTVHRDLIMQKRL